MQNTKMSGKADFRGNRIGIAWSISTAPGKMLGVFAATLSILPNC
jgi:hypothetical protein